MSELKKKLSALSALQNEYIKLVEEESPNHEESMKYYVELVDELKSHVKKQPIKFAESMIQNPHFQRCLEAANGIFRPYFFMSKLTSPLLLLATLYLPILDLLQMTFRGHKYLSTLLIQEVFIYLFDAYLQL